jgi:hypothetical protein
MKFCIVKSRLRHAGHPGTTTPGPTVAMLGSNVVAQRATILEQSLK